MAVLLPVSPAAATPKVLEPAAIASPGRQHKANVEWEDIGFIGVIRMNLFHPNGDPHFSVELPEINPSPANLIWIDEEWIACESFIGDNGSGFFYVHVPTRRGYLIDIIAPRPDADWVFNFSTTDSVSTAAIRTVSKDRDSLFPILLRDLPTEGPDYFTTEFCNELREAVDGYTAYRKKEILRTVEFLSGVDIRTSAGAITVASFDNVPSVAYFPLGTTTTAEMLQRFQRQPLPDEAQKLLNGVGAPVPRVRWVDDRGSFRVDAVSADDPTSVIELMAARFDDVHDKPYQASEEPQTELEVTTEPESKKREAKKPIPAAKGKPSRSKSSSKSAKKPSRAR
ncbi:MAG: hypothetical protein ACR2IE_19820 [Candidatus Sumerlaeaceae bacterium]